MKVSLILIIVFLSNFSFAQESLVNTIHSKLIDLNEVSGANEDFSSYERLKEMLKDVEIVMLGEQSHGEATSYDTKIKLVKFLHEEMGFDILAFESDFYACEKARQQIQNGKEMDIAFGKSVTFLWSTIKEIKPLTTYLEQSFKSDDPLKVVGFDNQLIGKYSSENYVNDLRTFINQVDIITNYQDKFEDLEQSISKLRINKNRRKEARRDTIFINELISVIENSSTYPASDFWLQSLKSTKAFISDLRLKTDFRDWQMAQNLIWHKENNPGEKIICWGATSHFLYNSEDVRMKSWAIQLLAGNYYKKQPMMGHYVKEKYGSKLFTIGFTAYEGEYGLSRKKKIKEPKPNSIESIIGQSNYNNCLLPLADLELSSYISRPLGNVYMKTNIANVMDAILFNRKMEAPSLDRNLFLTIYPENIYVKAEQSEE